MEATNYDYCKWICDRESKSAINSNGTLTLSGKTLVRLLKTNPDKILNVIKRITSELINFFVVETKKSFLVQDYDKLCKEVLESLKERFLPLNP